MISSTFFNDLIRSYYRINQHFKIKLCKKYGESREVKAMRFSIIPFFSKEDSSINRIKSRLKMVIDEIISIA